MIRISLIFFLGMFSLFAFINISYGNNSVDINESLANDINCNYNSEIVQLGLGNFSESVTQYSYLNNIFTDTNQSGCCSWHDGVCGCDGGRKVCCDGTLSPSCRC